LTTPPSRAGVGLLFSGRRTAGRLSSRPARARSRRGLPAARREVRGGPGRRCPPVMTASETASAVTSKGAGCVRAIRADPADAA